MHIKIKKKYISLFVGLLIILLSSFIEKQDKSLQKVSPTPTAALLAASDEARLKRVVKVIDGDTIEIENGIKVRYIGIDTPEIHHPKKDVQCFGKIAAEKNKELVEGKQIRLKKDISEMDRYGRLLRFVYLEEPTATGPATLFLNDYLVRQGYALASTYPPDITYASQFKEAEIEARENNRGLWRSCPLLRQ